MKVQTLISGSSGCCIAVWTEKTTLWLDCGFPSQKQLKQHLLPDAVVVSHLHQDHLSPRCVKALGSIPVYVPEKTDLVPNAHIYEDIIWFNGLRVEPFRVEHGFGPATYGFTIYDDDDRKATFFIEGCPAGALAQQANSHFVYIEANHDEYLLERLPNINSQYHLSNRGASNVLAMLGMRSHTLPTVMIGNISEQRNTPALARSVIAEKFMGNLYIAPRTRKSRVVEV